jgi:cysteine desulfurase/selenocysteine lyase
LKSVRQGGTGTESHDTRQPDEPPFKFEAGNLNVPGILGMGAGVSYLVERGVDVVHREGLELARRLLEGLAAIRGLRIVGPASAEARVPLVSFVLEGYDPQEVALALDSAYRIQCRPGLHCAPAMHEWLGTYDTGGTVRLSLGPFTTGEEIEATVTAVAEVAGSEIRI